MASIGRPTSYVLVTGGLGNQLFQFAFADNLASETGGEVCLLPEPKGASRDFELDALLHGHFDFKVVRAPLVRTQLRLGLGRLLIDGKVVKRISDPGPHSILEIGAPAVDNVLFTGYWQSESYFIKNRERIVEGFKNALRTRDHSMSDQVGALEPFLSVHVRLGDLVENDDYAKRFGTVGLSYYESAINALGTRGVNCRNVVLFSDSPESPFCRQVSSLFDADVVRPEPASPRTHLAYMSRAVAHICGNSTFSWWGAYLSGSPHVVFPEHPFRTPSLHGEHLCPASWMRA